MSFQSLNHTTTHTIATNPTGAQSKQVEGWGGGVELSISWCAIAEGRDCQLQPATTRKVEPV